MEEATDFSKQSDNKEMKTKTTKLVNVNYKRECYPHIQVNTIHVGK